VDADLHRESQAEQSNHVVQAWDRFEKRMEEHSSKGHRVEDYADNMHCCLKNWGMSWKVTDRGFQAKPSCFIPTWRQNSCLYLRSRGVHSKCVRTRRDYSLAHFVGALVFLGAPTASFYCHGAD
jgi:hypothetical protein